MKVVLTKDVKKVGKKNEIIEVSDGYGQNFLIKKGLAKPATPDNVRKVEVLAKKRKEKKRTEKQQYHYIIEELKNSPPVFEVKSDDNGTIFGSVNEDMIKDYLKGRGLLSDDFNIKVEMEEPIKKTGEHRFGVRLGKESSDLKVIVR